MEYINSGKQEGAKVVAGGERWGTEGYFIQPTVILTKDPKSVTMVEEIFGPVITAFVYDDADYEKTLDLIDTTSQYGLTGAM